MDNRKIVLSGIQPSGTPTLGNYIGALRNWALLQQPENYCYYCIANLHSTTVKQDPEQLKNRTIDLAALILACGIDPKRSAVFVQSDVRQHAELTWALSCNTYVGELFRMTQFKDKSGKNSDSVTAGLLIYPVLMAADILLYQTNLVPVGSDQKQHIEITRDIAGRFNKVYGDVFTMPEPYILPHSGRVMSLQDPSIKMSKSDTNPNAFVSLTDEDNVILNKVKRAVTDSEGVIAFSETKQGVSNLLTIYSTLSGKSMEASIRDFEGKGYGALKASVAEIVIEHFKKLRTEFYRLRSDTGYISSVLKEGAEAASVRAEKTLRSVYDRIGYSLNI